MSGRVFLQCFFFSSLIKFQANKQEFSMIGKKFILAAAVASLFSTSAFAETCTNWIDVGWGLAVKICSADNMKSGTYTWKNGSSTGKKFQFSIDGPNGEVTGGKYAFPSGEEESSNCYKCRSPGTYSVKVWDVKNE